MEKLREQYKKEIIPALMKKFEYKSVMQVPKLDKIVINIGLGDLKENPKSLENAMKDLEQITGQRPVITSRRRRVRNDHDGTSLRYSRSLFSSVLISSFPNRKLNLRFGFYSKFATTSQSASLTAPLGGEPFCGGMEPRGILRRLRRLRADWIFFLILRKAQNCGVDTP